MWKQVPLFLAVVCLASFALGDGSLCSTNNGGCGSNANCYGGYSGPSSITCVCVNGYYMTASGCVGVNACATNNGNCDAHATCTPTIGTWNVACACNPPYVGSSGYYCSLPAVNLCATNNGGCGPNAGCFGGDGPAATCVCNNGYYMSASSTCVAVNVCATNNGGCDATLGVCTTTEGTYDFHCSCISGYTGDGYYCVATAADNGGNGGSNGGSNGGGSSGGDATWDCPSPPASYWDWRYNVPGCDSLSVTYPSDLPAGQGNDCNIRIKQPDGTETTLNFHDNTGDFSADGTHTFDYRLNANWPASADTTGYIVEWVQVGGSNCHWTGALQCPTPPDMQSPGGQAPFDWNWTYPTPACGSFTITYPSDEPAGQANDVNVHVVINGVTYGINFHQTADWTGSVQFNIDAKLAALGFPSGTPYTIIWVQVGGTNYHWTGPAVQCTEA